MFYFIYAYSLSTPSLMLLIQAFVNKRHLEDEGEPRLLHVLPGDSVHIHRQKGP